MYSGNPAGRPKKWEGSSKQHSSETIRKIVGNQVLLVLLVTELLVVSCVFL